MAKHILIFMNLVCAVIFAWAAIAGWPHNAGWQIAVVALPSITAIATLIWIYAE